jgi:hydroxyacylglutathione hydrolase
MSISVERFITGPIETNSYLVISDSKECLIVDPSSGLDDLVALIREEQLSPQAIVITHGHFDHIGGIPEVLDEYPRLPVYAHPDEKKLLTDPMFNMSFMLGEHFSFQGTISDLDEGVFTAGNIAGTVFCIPGHSPGGCALLVDKYLLCGDILFAGSVGRTDFPGGSQELLIDGIRKKLLPLDDEVVVCPGHGGRSTIGRERRMNPYF